VFAAHQIVQTILNLSFVNAQAFRHPRRRSPGRRSPCDRDRAKFARARASYRLRHLDPPLAFSCS
jgi:hypothetical protein